MKPWLATIVGVTLFLAALPAGAGASAPGELFAFGSNYFGELGNATNNGTSNPNPTPAPVPLPGATGSVVQVAAGGFHSLALTSTGQLFAFGYNVSGQLGSATNSGSSNPSPTPAPVGLPGATSPVVQVAAGFGRSLAVTAAGQLYAFGDNYYGELGNTANVGTSNPNPGPALVSLPGATSPVVQAAAGDEFSLAVTATGQLYAFGYNWEGQLGSSTNNNTGNANPTPTLVSLPDATGPVVQVAAGDEHTLAVTSTGQLYTFGNNVDGQLGRVTNSGTDNPNPTPALVALPGATGPVVQVAAGADHSLAVTSTGQLYAFGDNVDGQLGSSTNNNTGNPNPTPMPVSLPGATGPVLQAGGGADHSLAVTSTGQLYAFGYNDDGELGTTTNTGAGNPNPTPVLVQLPDGASVDTVARGPNAFHSLVVLAELTVATGSLPAATVGVSYAAALRATGGAGRFRWSASGLPPGLSIDPSGGLVVGVPTSASSSYSPTVTVTDGDGITAAKQLPMVVHPAFAMGATPRVPRLFGLATSPRTFTLTGRPVNGRCVRATRAKRARRHCVRTLAVRITYVLTLPATVRFTFSKSEAGRLVHGSCLSSARANRNRPRCTRRLAIPGTLTRASPAGRNSFTVTGRVGGRALAPGAYQLSALPAGGTAVTTSFSIRR